MDGKTLLFLVQIFAGLFFLASKNVMDYIGKVLEPYDPTQREFENVSALYAVWNLYIEPYLPQLLGPFLLIIIFKVLPINYTLPFGAGLLILYFGLCFIPHPRLWSYLDYIALGAQVVKTALEYLLLCRQHIGSTPSSSQDQNLKHCLKRITGFWIGHHLINAAFMALPIHILSQKYVIPITFQEKTCSFYSCYMSNSTVLLLSETGDTPYRIGVTASASVVFLFLLLSSVRNKLANGLPPVTNLTFTNILKCFRRRESKMLIPILGYTYFFIISGAWGSRYLYYMARYISEEGDEFGIKTDSYSIYLNDLILSVGNIIGAVLLIPLAFLFGRKDKSVPISIPLGIHILVNILLLLVSVSNARWSSHNLVPLIAFGSVSLLLGVGEAMLNIMLYFTIHHQFKGSFITILIFWKICQGVFLMGSGLLYFATDKIWGTHMYDDTLVLLTRSFSTVSICIAILGGILFTKVTKRVEASREGQVDSNMDNYECAPLGEEREEVEVNNDNLYPD